MKSNKNTTEKLKFMFCSLFLNFKLFQIQRMIYKTKILFSSFFAVEISIL